LLFFYTGRKHGPFLYFRGEQQTSALVKTSPPFFLCLDPPRCHRFFNPTNQIVLPFNACPPPLLMGRKTCQVGGLFFFPFRAGWKEGRVPPSYGWYFFSGRPGEDRITLFAAGGENQVKPRKPRDSFLSAGALEEWKHPFSRGRPRAFFPVSASSFFFSRWIAFPDVELDRGRFLQGVWPNTPPWTDRAAPPSPYLIGGRGAASFFPPFSAPFPPLQVNRPGLSVGEGGTDTFLFWGVDSPFLFPFPAHFSGLVPLL